jgi:hypothetical protein
MEAGDFVKSVENPDDFVRFHIFLGYDNYILWYVSFHPRR